MPLTGSQHQVVRQDYGRGGTWVVSAHAMNLNDEARYRDLARRFPDTYEYVGGELRERKVLIGSPRGR